ncbi:hypothetical protein V6N12_029006 [Hibiscus sabdariffa]|uniref:Uncharacterized protein n=1 Tax=Hibiscus sabdariffa TaxID=183260 RepID=A0ABR2F7Q3_9ROSI
MLSHGNHAPGRTYSSANQIAPPGLAQSDGTIKMSVCQRYCRQLCQEFSSPTSMASASKTLIKVFLNEEIKKKYDEVFASRPFIFEKSFDVKEEPNIGFMPEFMPLWPCTSANRSFNKEGKFIRI